MRRTSAFVVAIDVADASSLAAIKVGSFAQPHRRNLLGLGRVPLGELGHAVRVGLDPREHVVAPELELLGDVRDGHLPAATRERALENLDLRGGELGREGLQVGKQLLPIVVGRARRDGAAFRRLGPATRRRRRIRNDIPAPGNREGPVARATRGARARDGPAGAAREVMSADTCWASATIMVRPGAVSSDPRLWCPKAKSLDAVAFYLGK